MQLFFVLNTKVYIPIEKCGQHLLLCVSLDEWNVKAKELFPENTDETNKSEFDAADGDTDG